MILLPLLSMIVIFLLTKMMGYRQITQLSLYDYIIGITIGSIASELAVAHFDDFFQPVIAMVIFGIGTWLFSYLTRISPAIRNLVEGKAIVLFENGEINCQALKISKLDIDEFLMICRINGYFCLNDVDRIILETNGRFSFYPKTSARTLQVGDYQSDGVILSTPTGSTGYSMSAGGPLVSPDVALVLITPICPHSLHARPLVVSSQAVITVRLLATFRSRQEEALVTVDGDECGTLSTGEECVVCTSNRQISVLQLPEAAFWDRVRKKLQHSER